MEQFLKMCLLLKQKQNKTQTKWTLKMLCFLLATMIDFKYLMKIFILK